MLSIGEFSKICGVSTKTLRYYDEIGLIKPDEINPENGYRYYSIKQLKKMLFIDRLKFYFFSLEEIKAILQLDDKQSEEKLYYELNRKRREVQERLDTFEYALKQIDNDISNMEKGIPIMSFYDSIGVQLVETRPMNILYIRRMMSINDCIAGYGTYFDRMYQRIDADKLTMVGKPMTFYHNPEFDPAGIDTEFAIPVKEAVTGTRNLPGGLCARSGLNGYFNGLRSVYVRLFEWVENEGYELTDSPYEIYVVTPIEVAFPEDLITEVYFPIKKK